MFKFFLFFLAILVAAPLLAGQGVIRPLQKRIKKDRKDILFYISEIKDLQAKLKKDKSKALKYSAEGTAEPAAETSPASVEGQPTPVPVQADKWAARVGIDEDKIQNDRALMEKAQKDLGQANAQLSAILPKQ